MPKITIHKYAGYEAEFQYELRIYRQIDDMWTHLEKVLFNRDR